MEYSEVKETIEGTDIVAGGVVVRFWMLCFGNVKFEILLDIKWQSQIGCSIKSQIWQRDLTWDYIFICCQIVGSI